MNFGNNETLALLLACVVLFSAESVAAPPDWAKRGVDKQAEKQVDRHIKKGLEKQLEQQLARGVDKRMERRMANPAAARENAGKGMPASALEKRLAGQQNRLKSRAAEVGTAQRIDGVEMAVDAAGARYLKNRKLLMLSAEQLDLMRRRLGEQAVKATQLQGLGEYLVELNDRDYATYANAQSGVQQTAAGVEHLYQYQSRGEIAAGQPHWLPSEALPIALTWAQDKPVKLGLIDAWVDQQHPLLKQADMVGKSFIESGLDEPGEHGTAVASIVVGHDAHYRGLLPRAQLYCASVFYRDADGDYASVSSIVMALDWLAQQELQVVNMSLAGPANPILERAVTLAQSRGLVIVAAAGNHGPAAPPAYPAAYPNVIAVTAVDRQGQAYYMANRGNYIDFSAPGVNIVHSQYLGDLAQSSGTSFAAPFVSALLASEGGSTEASIEQLKRNALDLGEPSFDPIYGFGLVRASH